jgi:hypothetical protein
VEAGLEQTAAVVDLLNVLLEAERAGVQVLSALEPKVESPGLKLELLNRGQAWVAKRIEERVNAVGDAETRAFLDEMAQRPRRNVEACEAKLRAVDG